MAFDALLADKTFDADWLLAELDLRARSGEAERVSPAAQLPRQLQRVAPARLRDDRRA
ncbi:hypothetical protein [Paracoccus sp. (in: a-proteobacteria)]|uniref:hypothetical protein n=1 Tax=Paracoccus sp. TaxID=267 RepID=UPI0032207C09